MNKQELLKKLNVDPSLGLSKDQVENIKVNLDLMN